MEEYLATYFKETSNLFAEQSQKKITVKSFDIDCVNLRDFLSEDIRTSDEFRDFFIQLTSIKGACVYWWNIHTDLSNKQILDKFKEYKNDANRTRAIPALKSEKHHNESTKTLYVGKVKRDFYGRVIQHFGCHKTKRTQGLQLFYWAKDIELKLELNVIEFEKSMENIVPLIEYALANKLNPIIGKHY